MSTSCTGSSTSSTFPLMMVTRSPNPFARTISLACSAMVDMSIPYTCFAPALEAKRDRIPVPQPTSSTTLPLTSWGSSRMDLMYVLVRTESLSISSWIPKCA